MRSGNVPLSPAHRLLISVLRRDSEDARRHGERPQTWEALVPLAQAHRIPGVLASRLTRTPALRALAPSTVVRELEEVLRRAARLNFILLQRLDRFAEALAERGIPCVALKGSALARSAYGRIDERTFRDLDILVPRDRLEEAGRTLLGETGLHSLMGEEQDRHYAERHFHYVLRDGLGTVVELHWGLVRPASPYDIEAAGVLERSLPPVEGSQARLESLEDQILHAAAQCLSEGFTGLARPCDVETVLLASAGGEKLDWDRIGHLAAAGRLAPSLDLLLSLVERFFGRERPSGARGLPVPRSCRRGIEPLQPSRLVLGRVTRSSTGLPQLLRFWLLPGARITVIRHMILGHPRDRTRPPREGGGPSRAARGWIKVKRVALLGRLAGHQLRAMLEGREDHLSPS